MNAKNGIREGVSQRFILLVNFGMALLILAAVLILVRDGLSIVPGPLKKSFAEARKQQPLVKTTVQDYAIIMKHNPFGIEAGEFKPITAHTGLIPETHISLIGTVAGPKSRSYGIFINNAGEQEVFRVGEAVYGLGKLARVERDRVFIGAGKRTIEMPLTDMLLIKEVQQTKAGASQHSAFMRKISDTLYSIDQRTIRQAVENPNELMTDARLVPNVIDGEQKGFRLAEVKNNGIYQSLGLRDGDVLLRINDFKISSPETALQAFSALAGMDRVELDIMRNGSGMTMTYQIK